MTRNRKLEAIPMRPEHEKAYSEFVNRVPDGLLYHGLNYRNFLMDLLGAEEETLLALADNRIAGILPLLRLETDTGTILNSLPYFGSNGSVLAENGTVAQTLVSAYNHRIQDPDILSATVIENPFSEREVPSFTHNHTDERIAQFTSLEPGDTFDTLLSKIDASARRNVRKAMRSGIEVKQDSSALDWLYEIHVQNMSAIGGTPKSERFFNLLPKHFTAGQDYKVYLAIHEGRPVAGLLLFYFNRTVEYFTPVIVKEARELQPLALICLSAMAEAAGRGFRVWNWGGTWKSQTGVYRFKRKWAAIEKSYRYFVQVNDRSLLQETSTGLLTRFPGFYVLPFKALEKESEYGG